MPVNWCTSCKVVLGQRRGCRRRTASAAAAKSCARSRASGCLKSPNMPQRLLDDLDDCRFHRTGQNPAAQLDRPFHRRGGRFHADNGTDDKLTHLYHPPGYALWRDVYGHLPRSIRHWKNDADRIANYRRGDGIPARRPRKRSDFERTELAKEKTGVQIEGASRGQPGQRQRDPDLGFRLCPDELRHRRHHGRARPRHPRLGICQEVRPADHRSGRGRRCGRRKRIPICDDGHHGQLRLPRRPDRRRSQEEDHRSG